MADANLIPPHSDEAEQAVLGCLLLDNQVINDIAGLEAGHFYRHEYATVYERIRQFVIACKPADVLTVADSGVMSMGDLTKLAMSVSSTRNAAGYAGIIISRSMDRQLIRVGREIIELANDNAAAAVDKVDKAMSSLTAIASTRKASESVLLEDAIVAYLDRIQAEADGQIDVISTGLRHLDKILAGGLRVGELMVVGARPKMGKTAFTLAVSRNAAKAGNGVLVMSQEMPVSELVSRHVASEGEINLAELRTPSTLSDKAWSGLSAAIEELRPMKMLLDEQRGLTLMDVRRKVMAAKRRINCRLVVIDFLQLMAADSSKESNRNQELDRISNGLKAMAGEFGVAVILLSQLSREADKRHGPPVMTDLRDCGAIEAAADIIAMLYREVAHPMGEKGEMWKHHAQIEVVQRNGAPGTVNLWFSGEYQQFKDWNGPAPMRSSMGRVAKARSGGLD